MNSLLLSEADFSRLHHLYHHQAPPPVPTQAQRREIGRILASAHVPDDPAAALHSAGFDDEITLTSVTDPDDDFVFRIVIPREADPATDRISLFAPVSLAVIGRREGAVVEWEANDNLRRMRISSVKKATADPPATDPHESHNSRTIMKHDPSSPVLLRLQDGRSVLAEWTHHFDDLPTIGERLHIEDVSGDLLPGYRDCANVSRVGFDLRTGRTTLTLDAVPASATGRRNVVFLNANYIPGTLRREVEAFVRKHIDQPVFEWVRSQQPAPISTIHGPRIPSRPALGQLQAAIRDLIAVPS